MDGLDEAFSPVLHALRRAVPAQAEPKARVNLRITQPHRTEHMARLKTLCAASGTTRCPDTWHGL